MGIKTYLYSCPTCTNPDCVFNVLIKERQLRAAIRKDLNLDEVMGKIIAKKTAMLDNSLVAYIKSCVGLLESQGKDITQYALIAVDNPMELKEDHMKVTYQWRIISIDKLQNLPEYPEETLPKQSLEVKDE